MSMFIGIDTSRDKNYSCIVFGSEEELNLLYTNLTKEFKKRCNWDPPIHWNKIAMSGRYCIYKTALPFLEKTKLKFQIFIHKKEQKLSKKEYYLKHVPNQIGSSLERLLNKTFGVLNVECDKDYEIKNNISTTEIFLKNFINSISMRLTLKPAKIKEAKNEFLFSDIFHHGLQLRINAGVKKSDFSKSIQIADLILGMYFFDDKKELQNKQIVAIYKIN